MMQGGNPDDMDRVKGVIEAERSEVESTMQALQAQVDAIIPDIWNGPDADMFVAEFNDDIVARFQVVLDDLEAASLELGRNAEEQRATSAQ